MLKIPHWIALWQTAGQLTGGGGGVTPTLTLIGPATLLFSLDSVTWLSRSTRAQEL